MITLRRTIMSAGVIATYLSFAQAATVKTNIVKLHAPLVRLSDIFDGLTAGQDCNIGPAPAPGRRLVIPSAQISAIATQFGVDLSPNGGSQALYIERPARTVLRQELIDALRPALIAAGMETEAEISLGLFSAPTLAADETMPPAVAALDYDAQSGRFSANLEFAEEDGNPQRVRVVGRVEASTDALILAHPVAAGTPVTGADVVVGRVRKTSERSAYITDATSLTGSIARQNLTAGMPIKQDQLTRTPLISRNRPIVLKLTGGGLSLTATGIALEDGGAGDRVRVMNGITHAVLVGTVSSGAEVTIDPGTLPVLLAQSGGAYPTPHSSTFPAMGLSRQFSSVATP